MSGHMGNLSPQQQQMLDALKESELDLHRRTQARLTELDRERIRKKEGRDATEEEIAALAAEREEEWPYELLRFLRANKWSNLDATRTAYRAYLDWRERERMDSILDELPFNALLLDRVIGNNAEGLDKEGRPIYIEKSGSVHVDGLMGWFTDEDIIRSHCWAQENSVRRARESSKRLGKHVETFCSIIDLNGLSMSAQRASRVTKALFDLDAKYYPERMGHLYVVNAPMIFPLLWKLFSPFIDPVTRAKIHVVSGDPKEFLPKHIDPSQLPAEYGGTCDRCAHAPDCCKLYPLEEAVAILPLKDGQGGVRLAHHTLKAGKSHSESVTLQAGEVVEWLFQLNNEGQDVDFSVVFTPDSSAADSSSSSAAAVATPIEVVPVSRLHGCSPPLPAQCSYRAPVSGVAKLTWDNSHSWLKSKDVSLWVGKTDRRKEAHADAAQANAANAAAASSSSSQ